MSENVSADAPASGRHLCPEKMKYVDQLILDGPLSDFETKRVLAMAECSLDCMAPRREPYGDGVAGRLLLKLNIGKDVCGRAVAAVELPNQQRTDQPGLLPVADTTS